MTKKVKPLYKIKQNKTKITLKLKKNTTIIWQNFVFLFFLIQKRARLINNQIIRGEAKHDRELLGLSKMVTVLVCSYFLFQFFGGIRNRF